MWLNGAFLNSDWFDLQDDILSEISPGIFKVLGDFQATIVCLDSLQTTLAGTVFLMELDGYWL
jgi:hypothetical protein